jgi:hypothetical protein
MMPGEDGPDQYEGLWMRRWPESRVAAELEVTRLTSYELVTAALLDDGEVIGHIVESLDHDRARHLVMAMAGFVGYLMRDLGSATERDPITVWRQTCLDAAINADG